MAMTFIAEAKLVNDESVITVTPHHFLIIFLSHRFSSLLYVFRIDNGAKSEFYDIREHWRNDTEKAT